MYSSSCQPLTIMFSICTNSYEVALMVMKMNNKKKETFFSNYFNRNVQITEQYYLNDPYSNVINVYWKLNLDIPVGSTIKTNALKALIFEKIVNSHFKGNYIVASNIVNIDDNGYNDNIVVTM